MVSLVGEQLAESPFGQTDDFPDIWKRTETLLTSYRDEQFVNEQYPHELDNARGPATEAENITATMKGRGSWPSWIAS